jgi:transposase-like protein
MKNHEQTMLNMGCPDCGGEIELYETNLSGDGGKYRCKKCPRDTNWKVGKSVSFSEIINHMKAKSAETQVGKPKS